MKSMKKAIPVEIGAVKRRTLRSLAMERISKGDSDYIIQLCEKIESRVGMMKEDTRSKKERAADESSLADNSNSTKGGVKNGNSG